MDGSGTVSLTIKERGWCERNEKLASIRVRPGVSHRNNTLKVSFVTVINLEYQH
jgi:hypothetical protein